MKIRKGWILTLNKYTKKMTPFFVKVRSEDIVPTDPIDITAALKQTSTRWKLTRKEDRVDCTFYHYVGSWSDLFDANAEDVGSTFLEGELDYYLYKDGRMEMDGKLRVNGTYTAIDDKYAYINSVVYLPFAFEETPEFQVRYAFGACEGISSVATISEAKITNQTLNLNGKDTNTYKFALGLHSMIPVNDTVSTVVAIDKIRSIVETSNTYKACDYLDYVKSYLPLHISYKGFWRSAKSVEITKPESQDDTLSGTWTTIAPVNMYASANVNSERVRSLATKTSVQCSGYYTEVDGEKFLYVLYAPTAQYGYIHSSYLIKK